MAGNIARDVRKFELETAKWRDPAKMSEFLALRRRLLVDGPGGICDPVEIRRLSKYAPFEDSEYPYLEQLGPLSKEPWRSVLKQEPADLIDPNPFAPSRFREGGLSVWDASIGIPMCKTRPPEVLHMSRVPALRHSNTYWDNEAVPSMNHIGPLGPSGMLLRPKGEWIFDLTQMKDGWFLLEAAHALAHWRGDIKWDERKFAHDLTKTGGHLIKSIGEVLVSYVFDLPIDLDQRVDNEPGEPDNLQYGFHIRTSSRFHLPFVRLPWCNREAPLIDKSLAVINVGVYIQPHPYGFTRGTMEVGKRDHWACMPTIVVISGWEAMDFITHQALASIAPDSKYAAVCYTAHPSDLLPPETFWAYLELARQARGEPEVNDRYMYLHDWMDSEAFAGLAGSTPGLPCRDCLLWNNDADGKPKRPEGRRPKTVTKAREPKWYKYDSEIRSVYKIVDQAGANYEGKSTMYGSPRIAKRVRRERKRRHKERMQGYKEDRWFRSAIRKRARGNRLTKSEQRVYSQRASRNRKDDE